MEWRPCHLKDVIVSPIPRATAKAQATAFGDSGEQVKASTEGNRFRSGSIMSSVIRNISHLAPSSKAVTLTNAFRLRLKRSTRFCAELMSSSIRSCPANSKRRSEEPERPSMRNLKILKGWNPFNLRVSNLEVT